MDNVNKILTGQMLTLVHDTVYNIYYEIKLIDKFFFEMLDGGIR